ncbi:methyl-accepting chemotaxis protein [Paenibacillus filicis]|uniref:Methyl-accepting chemotaxis protein n=1 Tax=Paenibacillus gyeongsangnamensis TaxID=3388067 RepID=A0ABT4QDF9_9BACL|nr:methyl-accepting chemotaxis protein [Paenibacillus filicis]MCZ8514909.1 methyl-accepting chemotaxis protein [Paenibacillus filicis]
MLKKISWSKVKQIRFIFRSVKARLFISSLLILLVPGLLIGWITFNKSKSQIEELLMSSASENVALTNTYINNLVIGKEKELNVLAQLLDAEAKSAGKTAPRYEELLSDFLKEHPGTNPPFLALENGRFLTASSDLKAPQDYKPKETPWYKEAMGKDAIILTDPYQDAMLKDMTVTLARALPDHSGVVGIHMNLQELRGLIKDVHIGQAGYIVVYSKNKQFLLHPTTKIGTTTQPHNEVMYVQEKGSYDYIFKGEPKKMIYTTNPATGWKIAGNMSALEIDALAKPILTRTIVVIGISLLIGMLIVYFMAISILRPLSRLMQAAEKISKGDLTERVEVKKQDEIGKVGMSFNTMADALHTILLELRESSNQLAVSSNQLSVSSEQTNKASEQVVETVQMLATGTDEQVRYVDDSFKAISEISASAQQISASAESAADTSDFSSEKAKEGSGAIRSATKQMDSIHETVSLLADVVKGLGERSQEVTQIIEMISAISAQTNLLSLNAAIEAARAGEQGRGFAVVAGEVRKLAEQSAESAQQVGEVVRMIQEETDRAVRSMESTMNEVREGMDIVSAAGQSFEQIRESVDQVSVQIREVSSASVVMAESTSQVTESVQEVVKVAEQSLSRTQELSAAAQEQLASIQEISSSAAYLSKMSDQLKTVVDQFKI